MTNDAEIVETEKNAETMQQSVIQLPANATTKASSESTPTSVAKEAVSKDSGTIDVTDNINYPSNRLTVKTTIETVNFKRKIVEEEQIKSKKHKEEYGNQGFNDKNDASKPKPDSNEDKSGGSEPSSTDSYGGGPIVPPSKIMIPSDADEGTRMNGNNGNLSHHEATLPYVIPSEESPLVSNQPNSPKSSQKTSSDNIIVDAQKFQTRVLQSSNKCSSNSNSELSHDTSPLNVPEENLAQITTPATVKVEYTHLSPTTRSEQTENILATNSRDETQTICSVTATTTMTSESIICTKLSGMKIHPRRRKLKTIRTEFETSDTSSAASVTAVERNPSSTSSEPTTVTNSYQMFLNIRKQIEIKRNNLFPVQPKPPSGFKDYLMNRRTYILAGKSDSRIVNGQTPPPANLHEQLKKLFVEQEEERQKLRIQHIVEKEKLVLSVEQEILRVHGRAARALANQELPFSVCTILKDEEVYNILTSEKKEQKESHVRSRYNGRIFLSWLQDVDDKWEKIKESMLLRHHNEAESLYAVQKMDWGLKLNELQLCTYYNIDISSNDETHVSRVFVDDDFDLLLT